MKMSTPQLMLLAGVLSVSSIVDADSGRKGKFAKQNQVTYAKVLSVKPIYREIEVSTPVKDCWQEPVTHTKRARHGSHSAGATLAGGLIGGIIGHQFGKGRSRKASTAIGTLIGAQLGHDSTRGSHASGYTEITRMEKFCEVTNQVSYEEELDGYRVTYKYKGQKYKTRMPYDPGDRIKLRVSVEPVF